MDWLVIKGRGENRGKYLRQRYEGKGKNHKLVSRWVEKQAQADRHKEYDGGRMERLARKVNGYIVRIVAPPAIVARVSEFQSFISMYAARAAPEVDCYWLSGDDTCEDYCRDCAEEETRKRRRKNPRRANEFALDGGWSTTHDARPTCAACGAKLQGTLTDSGADGELSHYFENPPTFEDAEAWDNLALAVMNLRKNDPRWRKIARLVDVAAEAERRQEEHLAQLAAAPGMRETRAALLGLLQARQAQKKDTASYRLWGELVRYKRLPFSKTYKPKRSIRLWEKRLKAEAEFFLGLLGYRWGGTDCFKTPYGELHWVYVVEVEQHRLWGTPAFLEGAAARVRARVQRAGEVGTVPSKEGDNLLCRDSNPYPEDDPRHRIWDCGYVGVLPEVAR